MDIKTVKDHQEKFLTDTADARRLSEKCRDYRDGYQWTDVEAAKLRSRKQAPIVVNRVKPKVDGLLGLYNLRQSDPKAFARTEQHEAASHVVTDGLRFVADNNDFDSVRMEVADSFFVEGYGGAIVDIQQQKDGEIWIRIEEIPWDRIYFDPHSRKKDFSDARYMGIMLWMDVAEAEEKFPGVDFKTLINQDGYKDETFEDKPKWIDKSSGRIRIALHFEIHKSAWHMSVSTGDTFLINPQLSPYHDDEGEPTNPIELVSAYTDRNNGRYSETSTFLDQQDEINHRRSKFLHFMNSRQTFGRKGAEDDVAKLKRELKNPDGHVEFSGDQFGKDFGLLPQWGADQGQFNLYLDAKSELDAVSINAQLSGERQSGDLSGVAIEKLQQAGTLELNWQYSLLANWEKRIYRQIFARMKQFWTREKWIRITDNQDALRWVGFNTPVTVQAILEEKINDESEPHHVRKMAAQTFTQMMGNEDPRLQEVVEIRNAIPELDMDIILEQSFDSVNVQEEQFKMLAQFASGSDVDIVDLIKVSQLRGKDELVESIQQRRTAAAEQAGGMQQLETAERESKIESVQVKTAETFERAKQLAVETEMLARNPDPDPQAVI